MGSDPAKPSHAIGVVFRRNGAVVQYLLVRPKDGADEWVLPKGHVEAGETVEQAAVREVREEAGVRASIAAPLRKAVRFAAGGSHVTGRGYLMEYRGEEPATEARATCWLPLAAALRALSFDESRELLEQADEARRAAGL